MRAGSLQNLIGDNAKDAQTPEVGMGCTIFGWTDRNAATVIEVSRTGHKITVQYDTQTRTDTNGMSDAQAYEFTPNPQGRTETFTRRQNGDYRVVGGTTRCLVGVRDAYYDFGF
jgi:hypothetical protein